MCVIGLKLFRALIVAGILAFGLADIALATPIVSISGPDNPFGNIPGLSIGAGRVTQWQSTLAFEDVTVTADLASVPSVSTTATAFLTTRIGPGTTAADEVARATVSLPDFFAASKTVTLFSGLNLAPAHYYLTIVSSPTNGGIWWTSDSTQAETVLYPCDEFPCPVIIPGFPNWQMFTVAPNPYAPASVWTPFHFSAGEMHFAVDGRLAGEPPIDPPTDPPAAVPEPGTLILMVTGLAAGARKLRARRIAQTPL